MIKNLILIFFSFTFLFATNNIDLKIKKTKKTIFYTKTQISNMNADLDKLVKNINKQKEILNKIDKKISEVNSKIKLLESNFYKNVKNITLLEKQKEKLEKQKQILQKEVINFISNNYSIESEDETSLNDLINHYILINFSKISSKKMAKIANLYSQINSQINEISKKIILIRNQKKLLEKKKREIALLQKEHYKKLVALNNQKILYKKKLKKLLNEQKLIQNQLAKLNIIKKKQMLENMERAKREAKIRYNRTKNLSKADKIKVKNYGNLYMKSKIARYRGKKTIAPVRNGKIIKQFGAYIDPIYHIALYNDSITLKTPPNEKVRAIFSGKVVFVSNNRNNKMIVIEHKNHLHSIYAKLSRVSPFVKKGYRVKKGEIIAKSSGELEFEVTYKTYPINPSNVIDLK